MPRLVYTLDLAAPLLELAVRTLTVLRVQEFAHRHGLAVQEVPGPGRRDFILIVPLDELNGVLYELYFQDLLHPTQEIRGRPAAHIVLVEQFASLTWVDSHEDDPVG